MVGVEVGDHEVAHVGEPPPAAGQRVLERLEPARMAAAAGVHEHDEPPPAPSSA